MGNPTQQLVRATQGRYGRQIRLSVRSRQSRRQPCASAAPVQASMRLGGRFRREWFFDGWAEQPSALQDQIITVLGCDGVLTHVGAPSVRPHLLEKAEARRGALQPMPLPSEQGLCIGSVFTIAATNGSDATRRINLLGFCQSIEELHERVEGTVIARGGEVLETEARVRPEGLQQRLRMTVALPLLWGVPPETTRLKQGIAAGGGIVERCWHEWVFY